MLDQYLCVTIQKFVPELHVTPLNCSYSETHANVLKCVNLKKPKEPTVSLVINLNNKNNVCKKLCSLCKCTYPAIRRDFFRLTYKFLKRGKDVHDWIRIYCDRHALYIFVTFVLFLTAGSVTNTRVNECHSFIDRVKNPMQQPRDSTRVEKYFFFTCTSAQVVLTTPQVV